MVGDENYTNFEIVNILFAYIHRSIKKGEREKSQEPDG